MALVGIDATISLAFRHLVFDNADDGHEDWAAYPAAGDVCSGLFN